MRSSSVASEIPKCNVRILSQVPRHHEQGSRAEPTLLHDNPHGVCYCSMEFSHTLLNLMNPAYDSISLW